MDASRLLPAAALCLCLTLMAPAAPSQVPEPFNLTVSSYNFNTTLYWNYNRSAVSPYFQLEIWNKDSRSWDVIEHCRKIVHQFCDLSHDIIEPFTYYKVRVKGIVGTQDSNYTNTEINLLNAGIIGAPRVNTSIEDGMVVMDIWNPDVPSTFKEYGTFKYIVFYGNTSEEVVDCDEQACSMEIQLGDQLLCFFVQGSLTTLPMTIEKTEKICISNEEKGNAKPPEEKGNEILTKVKGNEIHTEEKVPTPFNLNVTSYNFNTTLHWKYSRPAKGAYFVVELRKKGQKTWTVIEACRNTFHHYCDLSFQITEPLTYYTARVKAIVENKESDYAFKEFTLVDEGIIGPPRVNGTIQDKMMFIDIWHPSVPPVPGKKTVLDYGQFNYIVYYGNTIEETDNCDSEACSSEILIKDQLYCFFVQGKSDILPMTTEKSEKICIDQAKKGISSQTTVIAVVCVIGILLLMMFVGYIVHRAVNEGNNIMPQSLSSVIRNMTSRIPIFPQSVQSYDQVFTSPIESPKQTIEEEQETVDVVALSTSSGSAYPPYQSSSSEMDLEPKEEEAVVEANSSNGYFHKVCSSEDSNNSLEPKTDEVVVKQEPTPRPKVLADSFGYDKPHFPQEMV